MSHKMVRLWPKDPFNRLEMGILVHTSNPSRFRVSLCYVRVCLKQTNKQILPGVVVHMFNLSTEKQRQVDLWEFEASWLYIVKLDELRPQSETVFQEKKSLNCFLFFRTNYFSFTTPLLRQSLGKPVSVLQSLGERGVSLFTPSTDLFAVYSRSPSLAGVRNKRYQ